MANIVVFQHGAGQHTGRLGATLRDHGFRLDIRRPDLEGPAAIPADLDNVHGVVSLGGLQNVDDTLPWIDAECEFLKAAHEAGLPVLGICLGHQLIAKALGGEVAKMDAPEAGYVPVTLNHLGQTDTMLAGVPWTVHQFQSHAYAVTTPPPGAAVLATGEACKVQAFKIGLRTYGVQYHLECDTAMVRAFSREQAELFAAAGIDEGALETQIDDYDEMFSRAADRFCVNLATFAFPATELLRV